VWRTDTYWFDVAITATLLMLGQLYLGRFSEYQPRWRRLIKSVVGLALIVATSVYFGRSWSWVLIAAILIGVAVVHGWWLPHHGVNGWTAEPRARYYELLGLDADGKRRR
jgi:hypothetical protein